MKTQTSTDRYIVAIADSPASTAYIVSIGTTQLVADVVADTWREAHPELITIVIPESEMSSSGWTFSERGYSAPQAEAECDCEEQYDPETVPLEQFEELAEMALHVSSRNVQLEYDLLEERLNNVRLQEQSGQDVELLKEARELMVEITEENRRLKTYLNAAESALHEKDARLERFERHARKLVSMANHPAGTRRHVRCGGVR